jgi:hypothetical protein
MQRGGSALHFEPQPVRLAEVVLRSKEIQVSVVSVLQGMQRHLGDYMLLRLVMDEIQI